MIYDERCQRFEMCITEGGLVKGVHYLEVEINARDEVCIVNRRGDEHPDQKAIVHKAFTLCGLTNKTFDEWVATEVTREDLPR